MTVVAMLAAIVVASAAFGREELADRSLTREEISRIVALGPWPAPWLPDPSNRVSGNAEAVNLGRLLFFDARLSPRGTHACSSCHRPERAWTDGRATAAGLAPSRRNTPSLLDVRYRGVFGWDGAADSLWAQSLRPILDPREMGSSAEHVRAHIAENADLAALYLALFGRAAATAPAEDVLVDAGKALAAFQETIVGPRTRLDDLRDDLAHGWSPRIDRWPNPAVRGLRLFIGKGGCSTCHDSPAMGRDSFHAVASSRSDVLDHGRAAGIQNAARSSYTLASRFSDARKGVDPGTIQLTEADRGAFRVPSLRGVKATAPYLHDGSAPTLADAITRHDSRLSGVPPLSLDETMALVAFLEML